jgi:hypothetical protein
LGIVTFPANAGGVPMDAGGFPAGIDCLVLTTDTFPANLKTSKTRVFCVLLGESGQKPSLP